MISIGNTTKRKINNFWNHCLFHPTDAVEDAWGGRILDRISEDGAIRTVRIYTMFEDIVYTDENGKLKYDFRVSDLRLDYLVQKGYDLLLAYAGMPDHIAASNTNKTSVSKNKTRYKGKLFNTSPPRDYSLWEEICYEYTRHNVERYGIETVSKWHCHCFNEPDLPSFFMSELPKDEIQTRCKEYCKLYQSFERGIRRVSDRIRIGGPAIARSLDFLGSFLDFVREKNLKLDYIAVHNYGTSPRRMHEEGDLICVRNTIKKHEAYLDMIRSHGFGNTEIIVDEWGAASHGFFNKDEAPELMFRETEVFSAYYVKLIHQMLRTDSNILKMMICLSGQHEMTEDFSGFRNFLTLNFIAKPIYNAYILASRLGEYLLDAEVENKNLFVIPTKNDQGDYAVLLSYSSDNFEQTLPDREETVSFIENISGRKITVWRIDKNTTNPYRLYQKMGIGTPCEEDLKLLREEGRLKPVQEYIRKGTDSINLKLTANCTYLITITE
ncbi:MAG: hypothetical protein IJY08_03170 [Clostridia bacterium]|nr:hypothetical protein [Clostridia bacterium]